MKSHPTVSYSTDCVKGEQAKPMLGTAYETGIDSLMFIESHFYGKMEIMRGSGAFT